jgi:hypothetical protein
MTRDVMTRARADTILKARVEGIVARYEPLDALYCPFTQAGLLSSHPAIGPYIPLDPRTVFKRFVVPIDVSAQDELISLMMKQYGLLTVAFDGVTVNRKSKVLFTVTRGIVSAFVTWIDLGSQVHVTAAEANAAFHIMKELKKEFKGLRITCIAVDNAAAQIVAKAVALLHTGGDRPFTLRDPVHCIDLGSNQRI